MKYKDGSPKLKTKTRFYQFLFLWRRCGEKEPRKNVHPDGVERQRCYWWKLDSIMGKWLWLCSMSQHVPKDTGCVRAYVKMLLYIHSVISKYPLCVQERDSPTLGDTQKISQSRVFGKPPASPQSLEIRNVRYSIKVSQKSHR